MSLAEQVKVAQRILVLDIETSPILTYTFDMRPNWISPEKIVEPSRMLCWGAKWLGDDKKLFKSEHHHGHAKMVESLWSALNKAEAVVGFNHVRFDLPHIRREFLLAGLPPPSPHKNIDLYRVAGQTYKFESKSMNHLAQRLGLVTKVQHSGFDLWKRCLAGDKAAWADMKAYQLGDIDVTEAAYWALLPWISNHPHLFVTDDGRPTCNRCPDGGELKREGTYLANQIRYLRYRCIKCNGWVRGASHSRAAVTHGIK